MKSTFNQKKQEANAEPESNDDLWILSQVVEADDIVKARTWRKIKLEGERKNEVIKKPVILDIKVEKIEFTGDSLRLSGRIINQVEDVPKGSYHTITIEPKDRLIITKEHWHSFQKQRLEESSKPQQRLLVCIFDRDEAHLALVSRDKKQWILHLKGEVKRKRMDEKLNSDFFADLRKSVTEAAEKYDPSAVILASPAFWKDELCKDWNAKPKNIVFASVSNGDETALNEVLVRDETKTALSDARISEEASLVNELLKRISKQGAACYGLKQVTEANFKSAIENLLITGRKIKSLREENSFAKIDHMMRTVDESGGKITVLDSSQDPGKRIDGLGGMAALLRFKI